MLKARLIKIVYRKISDPFPRQKRKKNTDCVFSWEVMAVAVADGGQPAYVAVLLHEENTLEFVWKK